MYIYIYIIVLQDIIVIDILVDIVLIYFSNKLLNDKILKN
jgi:hypothetical protein